jgi:prevent-host-death family protein
MATVNDWKLSNIKVWLGDRDSNPSFISMFLCSRHLAALPLILLDESDVSIIPIRARKSQWNAIETDTKFQIQKDLHIQQDQFYFVLRQGFLVTSMFHFYNVQICTIMYMNRGHKEHLHMKVISFTEFRKNASEVLNLVEKGVIIRVTRHGKTIAKIVPEEASVSEPVWKRSGLRLAAKGAALSKAILDERRSSR